MSRCRPDCRGKRVTAFSIAPTALSKSLRSALHPNRSRYATPRSLSTTARANGACETSALACSRSVICSSRSVRLSDRLKAVWSACARLMRAVDIWCGCKRAVETARRPTSRELIRIGSPPNLRRTTSQEKAEITEITRQLVGVLLCPLDSFIEESNSAIKKSYVPIELVSMIER